MIDFDFLIPFDSSWRKLIEQAQASASDDPDTCLIKLRILGEKIARDIALREELYVEDRVKQIDLLDELEDEGILDTQTAKHLHTIRQKGNVASHEHNVSHSDAIGGLHSARTVLQWYARRYTLRQSANPVPTAGEQQKERTAKQKDPQQKSEILEPEYVDPDPGSTAIQSSIPLAQQVFAIASRALSLGSQLGEPFMRTAKVLARCKKEVIAAQEPFRLGIVGDSRAGKSTLINAIAGDQLAFTSVIEATPVACCFRTGACRAAHIVYRDGTVVDSTVEDVNEVLDTRRHDLLWINSVDHIAFTTASDALGDLELWDAPGFGGSDHNDATAREFLHRIGGAVWVFDCQFLGVASHIAPLSILKDACKKVLGVINKVDFLDEDQYPLALDEARQRYGSYVCEFALVSAIRAFEKRSSGGFDPLLDNLLEKLRKSVLENAASDRQVRIMAAVKTGALNLATEIKSEQHALADRLGFIAHVERNLDSALSHVLSQLDGLLATACSRIFSNQESAARLALGLLFSETNDSDSSNRISRFKAIMDRLEDETSLPQAYRAISEVVLQQIATLWDRECVDAVRLSSAAVPDLSTSFPQQAVTAASTASPDSWIFERILAIVMGAAGGLAAIVMHLPILLAAAPLMLLEGWRFFATPDASVSSNIADLQQTIRTFVSNKQHFLREQANDQMRSDIRALLETEVRRLRASCIAEVLGDLSYSQVENVSQQLLDLYSGLMRIAGDGARLDQLQVRPLYFTPDAEGAALWVRLLSTPTSRLDVLVPTIDASLISVLTAIRPDVKVRIVTSSTCDSRDSLWPLLDWGGAWSATIIRRPDGTAVPIEETCLILDGEALVSSSRLSDINSKTVTFSDYPDGSMAAQRFFAELLEARASRFGPMIRTQYSQAAKNMYLLESEAFK